MPDSNAATATPEAAPQQAKPRTDPRDKPKQPPRYAVVLHNDPHSTFAFVILTLEKVFGYDLQKCYRLTNVVHRRGKAHAWTGLKEHAEHKAAQIVAEGADPTVAKQYAAPLKVTVEPLPEE